MKNSSVAILIGIVILLIGAEILLIYIACITQVNEDIKFQYQDKYVTTVQTTALQTTTTSALQTTTTSMKHTTISTKPSIPTKPPTEPTTKPSTTTSTTTTTTTSTLSSETPTTRTTSLRPTSTFSTPIIPPPSMNTTTTRDPLPTSSTEITNTTATKITKTSTSPPLDTETTTIPKFNYILRNKTGIACILTNMTIQINLLYANDSQIVKTKSIVPTDANTTGFCHENIAHMHLHWKEPQNEAGSNNENEIVFIYGHDDIEFFLYYISIQLNGNNFSLYLAHQIIFHSYFIEKKIKKDAMQRHMHSFSASIKYEIFVCKTGITIYFGNALNVVISNVYLIAFNDCRDNCTRKEKNCIAETNNLTGAIVGILIIGIIIILILVVLCLMWRARKSDISSEAQVSSEAEVQELPDPGSSCHRKITIRKWHQDLSEASTSSR